MDFSYSQGKPVISSPECAAGMNENEIFLFTKLLLTKCFKNHLHTRPPTDESMQKLEKNAPELLSKGVSHKGRYF